MQIFNIAERSTESLNIPDPAITIAHPGRFRRSWEAGAVLEHVDGALDGTEVMTLVPRHSRGCVQFVADYALGVRAMI